MKDRATNIYLNKSNIKKLSLLLFSIRANGIIKQWFLDYFSTFIFITKGDSKILKIAYILDTHFKKKAMTCATYLKIFFIGTPGWLHQLKIFFIVFVKI